MPKKRHSTLYSKPPSTAHRSLSSTAGAPSRSGRSDETPTVAELLTTLRASAMPSERQQAPHVITPSMPSEIRQLLNLPDTPTPRPRNRRRLDAEGRQLPAGPAPPSSWLTKPRSLPTKRSSQENDSRRNLYEIDGLPGLAKFPLNSSLMATCLRYVARDWIYQREYNRYYLATLPTKLRMILLSYIAFYGPEDGVGYDGLRSILHPCDESIEQFSGNDDFQRLDLSGSIGHSISLRRLRELIVPHDVDTPTEESWDTEARTIPQSLSATPILSLKMLSLSYPPRTVSWANLLSFATHIPTVTHLSLANWPTPTLTPNSTTITISSRYTPTLNYSGTSYYSHTLDGDWSEATSLLRRLSNSLYSLEYLDLDACPWSVALRYSTADSPGIDWRNRWGKVRTISLRGGMEVTAESASHTEIIRYKCMILDAMELEKHIRMQRGWITVVRDEWRRYDHFWTAALGVGEDIERAYRDTIEGRSERGGTRSLTRTRSIGQLRRRAVDFWD